jgi:hypothetical protein
MLKKDFDFEAFYTTLDEYLLHIMNEHEKYSEILKNKRDVINDYLKDIEKAITDDVNILTYETECDELDEKLNSLYDEVAEIGIFNSSFPSNVLVEKSLSLLEDIKKHFINLEKYENCAILQEVIDLLNE